MNFDEKMSKNEHVKRAKDGLDVWNDIYRYAKDGFASIDPDDFARMRWYGIYQQKPNEGHFMWRIKIPGGRLSPVQLRTIAQMGQKYGRGFGDITTRQDIQFHWLTIDMFPDMLDTIYNKLNLFTEFSCGDTPRNVVSCPLSGLLKNQICDIGDLVQGLSNMYRAAGKELSNLPRKFKPSFSACPLHCPQPQVNDVSAFGVIHPDGRRGMGVMAGGGLSSTPHFGQGLRVFVPEEKLAKQMPEIFYQIACIFRDADELRYKRKRARLKFLLADRGWQWFRDELERRLGYELEHDESIINPHGALHTDHMGVGELNNGLFYVGIPVERGRWNADAMVEVANLIERFAEPGKGEARLSQKQNLILVNIPKANVAPLTAELEKIGLPPHAPIWRESLLSCTGTQFCNLAVVETKQRAYEILKHLEATTELDSPIMLSVTGCPNACAQYQIADIGLTGTKAQFEGQKVDAYDLVVGGRLGETPEFGMELIEKVPSPVIHKVIERLVKNYQANRVETTDGEIETFRDFVDRVDLDHLKAFAKIEEWTPPPPRASRAAVSATA